MPSSRDSAGAGKVARLVRLPASELEAWKSAAALAGESLSTFARAALVREVARRREAQAVEVERPASDPFGLDALLERASSRTVR